ncbi:UDP-N-acetylmuramoyl-tripeptide--D-alanyl-D-alanine ligase [Clostridiaceae bacterium 35-E11]
MKLTVQEVVYATKGKLIRGDKKSIIHGVSMDSRSIKKNEIFIPLIGEKFNGHDFIKKAIDQGATAILASQWNKEDVQNNENVSMVQVEDTLQALHGLARYYLSKFPIPVIAVTGSTGKTTTKDMIASVLSKKYNVLKNKGNYNNHIGLPMTVFELEPCHEIAVFEMGMSNLGEISKLSDIAQPNIGVITNIGLSHIEHLGCQENIFKAKMEITNSFDASSRLIVNGDDKFLRSLKSKPPKYQVDFVGFGEDCTYRAMNVENLGTEGVRFQIKLKDKLHAFTLNIPGEHNVYNALCAIDIGMALEMDIKMIQQGLEEFHGSKMRLHIFNTNDNIKVINDAYNASPDSMKAAIAVLEKIEGSRKIAVLGDMLEMGTYSQKGHYDIGSEISRKNIDILITVGKEAQNIGAGAIDSGFDKNNIFICKNNQEAIKALDCFVQKGDIILVKGSRGMHMEEIVEYAQERS